MSTLVVFTGTSLRPRDVDALRGDAARRGVALDVRPPIVRRDLVALAADADPDVRVLLLDGEFGQQLAVSVTEIRDYLATGRYLAGGSSMGALRAAECRTLGMRAHGWVAARYVDGTITADAEVALLFDPASFEPVTVPQVNVRSLVGRLTADGTLTAGQGRAGFALSAELHYRARTPGALRRRWEPEVPALAGWLADDRRDGWDVKRLDAIDAVRSEIAATATAVAA